MKLLKFVSYILGIAFFTVYLISCDKNSLIDSKDEIIQSKKLGFEDFEIGKSYPLEKISQEVLDALEIDINNKARGNTWRIRQESSTSGDCNIPYIEYPNGWDQSLENPLLWTGPSSYWDGLYDLEFKNSGSGACYPTDDYSCSIYEIIGGQFNYRDGLTWDNRSVGSYRGVIFTNNGTSVDWVYE